MTLLKAGVSISRVVQNVAARTVAMLLYCAPSIANSPKLEMPRSSSSKLSRPPGALSGVAMPPVTMTSRESLCPATAKVCPGM